MQNQLLNIRQAAEFLNVTPDTLRVWDKTGKLKPLKTAGNHRRYSRQMLNEFIGLQPDDMSDEHVHQTVVATYARVSSHKQKVSGDLDRQSERLLSYCKDNDYAVTYEIKDVGSGLNDRRPGFVRLTDLILNSKIDILVIENKDRLTRFQYHFIKKVFTHYGCKTIVVNDKETVSDAEELTTDMMSLLASFSGKYYNRRSLKNRKPNS